MTSRGGVGAVNKAITVCRNANKRKTCERAIRAAANKLHKHKKARKSSRRSGHSKRRESAEAGFRSIFR